MKKNNKLMIQATIVTISCIILTLCNLSAEEHVMVKSINGLVLRDGPNQQDKKIFVIPNNTELEVLQYSANEDFVNGISAKWVRVKYNKYKGWVFGGYLVKNEYLLIPKDIIPKQFSSLDASFNCDGRSWHFDNAIKPKIKGNILYFIFNKNYTISTAPEELNEKPIKILGKKNIVFQLEKEQDTHIIFKTQIVTNDYKYFNYKIDAYRKSEVKIPIPNEGKTINNFQVSFIGDNCNLGIKSIYIE